MILFWSSSCWTVSLVALQRAGNRVRLPDGKVLELRPPPQDGAWSSAVIERPDDFDALPLATLHEAFIEG